MFCSCVAGPDDADNLAPRVKAGGDKLYLVGKQRARGLP
jgi:hypothetical protein